MDTLGKLNLLVILSAIFAVVWTQGDTEVTISLDISEEKVHRGANITLNCRIKGIQVGDIVYWTKGESKGEGENPAVQMIATNDLLTPLFQATKRYHTSIVVIGDVYMFIMHIYNVTEFESGTFVCSIPRLEYKKDYAELNVFEQAKDIKFMNATDEKYIHFTENQLLPIHCHVTAVNPVPKMTMFLGNRDISSQMSISPQKNIYCEVSSESCPMNVDYDVHAVVGKFNASWMDDGKELICQSRLLDSGFNPVEVVRTARVEYRPKFMCDTQVKGAVGTKEYELACHVFYNPPPVGPFEVSPNSTQYWMFRENDMDVKLPIGQTIGAYSTFAEASEENSYVYTLVIDELQTHHVNVTYHLHVTNPIGHNTTAIYLMEDVRDGGNGGINSAAAILSSLTTLLIAVILSVSR